MFLAALYEIYLLLLDRSIRIAGAQESAVVGYESNVGECPWCNNMKGGPATIFVKERGAGKMDFSSPKDDVNFVAVECTGGGGCSLAVCCGFPQVSPLRRQSVDSFDVIRTDRVVYQ